VAALVAAVLCGPAGGLRGQTNSMNFESVNATQGGVDATAYLASYGITLTNVSPSGTVDIVNDTNYYGGGAVFAPSKPNFLLQSVGGSPDGVTYTMLFSTPLQSLSFTRCAIGSSAASPSWSAVAYAGTNIVASNGVCCIDSDTGQTNQVFTMSSTNNGITSLVITANGGNFTAISSVPLDNFVMLPAAVRVANLTFGTGYGNIAVNPGLDKIFLTTQGAFPLEIDGTTFAQSTMGMVGDGVDVDVTNNYLWEADLYSGSVSVWDASNNLVTNISLSACPTGINVDAIHRRVWVSAQCGGGNDPIWAINADTFAIESGPIGSGGVQGSTFVNPVSGRFYLSPSTGFKRINPSNSYALTTCKFGTVIGVNVASNYIYAVTNGTNLQIINGAPDPETILHTVNLGFSFGYQIGVIPSANRIYVGAVSSNFVAVLNAATGARTNTITLDPDITGVGNIAVDQYRGRVYVLAYASSTARLYVIQDDVPPTIGLEPASATVATGGATTLSVAASGYPLFYQWSLNGTNIAGANGSTLSLNNISAATMGVYTVTVTNGSGAVTSTQVSVGLVDLKMFSGLVVDGPSGAQYSIQSTSTLNPPSWTTLTNVTLGASPYTYIDYTSPTNVSKFYRALPLVP
jgi:hypothetical protein